jgi:hypothetical protein
LYVPVDFKFGLEHFGVDLKGRTTQLMTDVQHMALGDFWIADVSVHGFDVGLVGIVAGEQRAVGLTIWILPTLAVSCPHTILANTFLPNLTLDR